MVTHIDFEARSRRKLRDVGAHVWMEDPSCRVLCVAYSIDEGEVKLWCPSFPLVPGELMRPEKSVLDGPYDPPYDLFEAIEGGDELWAHNAAFERAMFEIVCGPRMGWPVPRPEQWNCTMVMCGAHGIPMSLDKAAPVLGLGKEHRKDKDGSRIMRKLAQPRSASKNDWSMWHEKPEDLQKLFEYCKQDVRAEQALHRALNPLKKSERRVYHIDQRINFRGVAIDRELCEAAMEAAHERETRLLEETVQLTEGEVTSFKQVAAVNGWLEGRGIIMPNLQKDTVAEVLQRDDLDPKGRRLLEIRKAGGKTSITKYGSFLEHCSVDGRFRGGAQFNGAWTGRWAGRGPQFHNIPRGVDEWEQEYIISALKQGGIELLGLIYDDPMNQLSNVLRGVVIAVEGKKLVVGDWNAIEARGSAWFAEQDDFLELYRKGVCLYCWMAGQVFGVDPLEIDRRRREHDPEAVFMRRVGKTLVLGCGYGMGLFGYGAYCEREGLDISPKLRAKAHATYRKRAHKIVQLWRDLEAGAIRAVENPGTMVRVGRVVYRMGRSFLQCRIPSGRKLCYCRPRVEYDVPVFVEPTMRADGTIREGYTFRTTKLHYWGVDGVTKQFRETDTFGGKLLENACQAAMRDVLAETLVRLEDSGAWPVVMHVHDEVVCEVDEDVEDAPRKLEDLMAIAPAWADGLPIKAEAWEGKRYRK